MARLEQLSKRIFRALHLTGYARMDFRLRDDGSLYVLEANANPNISMAEDFSQSALTAGMRYRDVAQSHPAIGHQLPGQVARRRVVNQKGFPRPLRVGAVIR